MSIDSLHLVSVVIFITQMAFILKYYVPLMQTRDEHKSSADGDAFVSDFLFSDDSYRSFMTLFVSLQLLSCALLVWRWKEIGKRDHRVLNKWVCACCVQSLHNFMFYAEMALFGCTWVGWITLCSDYSGSGGTSYIHAGGVGVFVSGSFIYFMLMAVYVCSRETSIHSRTLEIFFFLIFATFFASCYAGFLFIGMALRRIHDAWIYEHAAYVLFCICHVLLFGVDWWMALNPAHDSIPNSSVYCGLLEAQLFERVRIRFANEPRPYPHTVNSLAASRLLCL